MTDPDLQRNILAEYEIKAGAYQDLASTASNLIERILRDRKIQLHSITSRHKSQTSLEAKLRSAEKNYTHLSEITDLSAIRITVYFAEDVDLIATIIEKEFRSTKKTQQTKGY